jgi:TatA/E family protein of Tat protein translocase
MLTSPVDLVLVGGVALLLLGPKRLPEFGKALGKGIGDFKRALSEAQDQPVKPIGETKSPASSD